MAIVAILMILGFAIFAGAMVFKNMLYICGPNEVLVFAGGKRRAGVGRVVGYRVVKGGRGLRIPLLERVHRLDLTNMSIEVSVEGAFSKGGIPLTVQGVANVKIGGTEPILNNAIERFLGKKRSEVVRIAQETLEGNLRGVLATLTPEQLNEDKVSFAESLQHEADVDLRKIGLVLDMMKVQNVHDNVGYLDSIGRKQTALVQKRARVAEAKFQSESKVREAENKRQTALAQIDAEIQAVRAEMERRIVDANTKAPALVAEQESVVKAALARAEADIRVQEARVEQVRRQLEADIVQPAIAAQKKAESDAKADAATILEDGAATAAALREVTEVWRRAGDHARDIFLLQKLDAIMKTVVSTIDNVNIEKFTMVDAGGGERGEGLSPARLLAASEQIKATLGVDVPALVNGLGGKLDGAKVPAAKASGGKSPTPPTLHR